MQNQEIEGEVPFDLGLYHSRHYEELMKEIKVLRRTYRETNDMGQRKEIAQKEYSFWNRYVEKRKNELPEKFEFTPIMREQLTRAWDFVANRRTQRMDPKDTVTFFKNYTDQYKFQIGLDYHFIIQMVHPHWAYLTFMPDPLEKESFMELVHNLLVASYERSLGQDLLSDELSAFGYWKYMHHQAEGVTDVNGLLKTLKLYRFFFENFDAFKSEFKFLLESQESTRNFY